MTDSPLPPSFQRTMQVPRTDYRTAIAIKHEGQMSDVTVTFDLRTHDSTSATYAARCPRCNTGDIAVTVSLDPDGSFAEAPACPSLCMACEDKLDAMLDPVSNTALRDEPGSRATLSKYLEAMSTRSWD